MLVGQGGPCGAVSGRVGRPPDATVDRPHIEQIGVRGTGDDGIDGTRNRAIGRDHCIGVKEGRPRALFAPDFGISKSTDGTAENKEHRPYATEARLSAQHAGSLLSVAPPDRIATGNRGLSRASPQALGSNLERAAADVNGTV